MKSVQTIILVYNVIPTRLDKVTKCVTLLMACHHCTYLTDI